MDEMVKMAIPAALVTMGQKVPEGVMVILVRMVKLVFMEKANPVQKGLLEILDLLDHLAHMAFLVILVLSVQLAILVLKDNLDLMVNPDNPEVLVQAVKMQKMRLIGEVFFLNKTNN